MCWVLLLEEARWYSISWLILSSLCERWQLPVSFKFKFKEHCTFWSIFIPLPKVFVLGLHGRAPDGKVGHWQPTVPLGVSMSVLRPDFVPAFPGCPLLFSYFVLVGLALSSPVQPQSSCTFLISKLGNDCHKFITLKFQVVYNLLTAFSLAAPNAGVPAFCSWKVWPVWQPYSFYCLTSALHTSLVAAFCFFLLRPWDPGLWRSQNVKIKGRWNGEKQ